MYENQDPLKLILNTASVGISGFQADDWFISKKLFAELPEPASITFCLGFSKHQNLVRFMKRRWEGLLSQFQTRQPFQCFDVPPIDMVTTPDLACALAWRSESRTIFLQHSEGYISAELICPYPPGIPILIPGEKLDHRKVNWLLKQRELWPNQVPSSLSVVA